MLGSLALKAQETNVASGGNLSGSGGSVTYSVGQVMNSAEFVNTSIQKPSEVDVLQNVDEIKATWKISTFPNPSNGLFVLTIEDVTTEELSYEVLDLLGEVVDTGDIVGTETSIDLSHLTASTYVLAIIHEDKEIKNLKLIKQ